MTKTQNKYHYPEETPSSYNMHEAIEPECQAFSRNEPTHRDCMFRGCGVGSRRGGQSPGSNGDRYGHINSDAQE